MTVISIVCLVAVLVVSIVFIVLNEQIKNRDSNRSAAAALDGRDMQNIFDDSSSADNSLTKKNPNKIGVSNYEDLCLTAGCVHSASNTLEMMDNSVDPCDDFYSYACGKFVQDTIIPGDKTSVNTFSTISDKLQEQLRSLVNDPINPDEPKPFKLAKELYNACMNKSMFQILI